MMTPFLKRITLGIITLCMLSYVFIYQGAHHSPLVTSQLKSLSYQGETRGTQLTNCTCVNETKEKLTSKCFYDDTNNSTNETSALQLSTTAKPNLFERLFHTKQRQKPSIVKRVPKGPQGNPPPIPAHDENQEVVLILMLSYQRSGSSFMGNLMNRNPSMFYVYEPLDALYSSLYGIPPGWSVPSDITGNKDGSVRVIPKHEVMATADTVTNLLTCEFDKLPKEVLISQFWLQFWDNQLNILDFTKCLHSNRINVGKCQALHLKRYCAPRVGVYTNRDKKCMDILSHKTVDRPDTPQGKYVKCILQQTNAAAKCFPALKDRCLNSPVRGTKTVRATMEMASVLLERHPNLKVLHLFRDPRPVMLSRMKHQSFRSYIARKSIVLESKFYCGVVESDIELRNKLMKQYPNRIKEVIYEDFVNDPIPQAKAIYEFLGISFPESLQKWLLKNTKKSSIAGVWKKTMKEKDRVQMEGNCKNLFLHGSHIWEPTH